MDKLSMKPEIQRYTNYYSKLESSSPPSVTYWMNLLQGIQSPEPLFVTLNREGDIDPSKIYGQWEYRHPQFTFATAEAQSRLLEIQGVDRIWYAGAYWGYGFHEDGARSGVLVARNRMNCCHVTRLNTKAFFY